MERSRNSTGVSSPRELWGVESAVQGGGPVKEPAVITEIDGQVRYGDVAKQHRKIFVTGDDEQPREYQVPRGAHISVQEGERVRAGEALMDGPIDPHDWRR